MRITNYINSAFFHLALGDSFQICGLFSSIFLLGHLAEDGLILKPNLYLSTKHK